MAQGTYQAYWLNCKNCNSSSQLSCTVWNLYAQSVNCMHRPLSRASTLSRGCVQGIAEPSLCLPAPTSQSIGHRMESRERTGRRWLHRPRWRAAQARTPAQQASASPAQLPVARPARRKPPWLPRTLTTCEARALMRRPCLSFRIWHVTVSNGDLFLCAKASVSQQFSAASQIQEPCPEKKEQRRNAPDDGNLVAQLAEVSLARKSVARQVCVALTYLRL